MHQLEIRLSVGDKAAVRIGAMEVVSADLETLLQRLATPLQDTLQHMLSIIADP
ncbi:hypothetical protein [Trichococcus ilyis]|uniref:hypothetical protein n=1 Tax=Trichococcus ilyis TaxID=640938 RepID=UPI0012ECF13E|nr:hypothetical protein [Trichococcus ilyis]